jgi:cytochrome c-type biogenesis protein CcmH
MAGVPRAIRLEVSLPKVLLPAVSLLGAALLAASLLSPAAFAVEPDEILDDPALEQRAREISKGIRCVVCQNESIDSSNADLAKDMRVLIRDRLQAGDSNAEVKAYLVDRYGDYVLLNPPMKPETYLLWFGPAAVLLLGAAGVIMYFRRYSPASPTASGSAINRPLSDEEHGKLRQLLDEDDGNGNRGGEA